LISLSLAVVGVPDRTPAADSDKPGGSEPPANDQVNGPVPPDAAKVVEYGVRAVALGMLVVATVGGLATTVSERPTVAKPPSESDTLTING
jgi:hypothetical protein